MEQLNLSGKRIFIMRALWEQIPLIKEAKEYGATVIAVDEDEDAEGLSIAHESETVPSLRDLDACLDVAKDYDIDAVVSDECDYSAFATAYIGERLKIPSIGVSAAQITTNKKRLRRRLDGDISQPDFKISTTTEEAERAAKDIGYPLIIKPVDNRGAFGVSRVESPERIDDAFLSALANSHSREVILEEFVSGTPITVEGYYVNGTHRTMTMGSKDSSLGNLDPQREIRYPADLSDESKERVHRINNEVASYVGGFFGATHAEYIITDSGGCYPIEFHNRGGGIHISAKVVPEITGFNVSQQLLADSLGLDMQQGVTDSESDSVVVYHSLELPQGTIIELSGREKVRRNPDILTFKTYFDIEDTLEKPESPVQSHGLIIAKGDTYEEASQTVEKVYESLNPAYAEDE